MALRKIHTIASRINISAEVTHAVKENLPVVALESTIITHGMPSPHNYNTAIQVEDVVRKYGGVPATIGIIEGVLKIGLNKEEIAQLADPGNAANVVKTSRRDLPVVISKMFSGGTTVSATIIAARYAGIKLFVTGGIGGVHRGGQDSLDISADLIELGRNPIAVVCSGVKSILDIERTLEYLETQGVCVATFGSTREFPAFYTSQSAHLAPYNVCSAVEAAALVQSLEQLKLQSGILLAVPVPVEDEHVSHTVMEQNIQTALKLAEEQGIKGKAVTPFVLQKLAHLTEGHSLKTNVALIKNNAMVGTQIAVELQKNKTSKRRNDVDTILSAKYKTSPASPIVIGGSVVDCVVRVMDPFKVEACTLNGHYFKSGGGVARNLADALGKLEKTPKFISAIGGDEFGQFLLSETLQHVNCEGVLISKEKPTARYTAIVDNEGEFRMGIADMDIHNIIIPSHVEKFLTECPMVIIDGNIPFDSIQLILEYCHQRRIPVMFEPTDVAKAAIPFQTNLWKTLNFISPNLQEFTTIASHLGLEVGSITSVTDTNTLLQEVTRLATPIATHIQTILVTLGHLGVLIVERKQTDDSISARYYPAAVVDNVVSAVGAGDCVAAGIIAGRLAGLNEPECVAIGFAAGVDSLNIIPAVPSEFKTVLKPVQYTVINNNCLKHEFHSL